MSTEIATIEATALTSHRAATNAAGLCRDLVVKTAMKIQGRRYVQVEGWQAIANAFGCVASAKSVERVDGGFRATGQVVRISDGVVIAEAEGFVGDDEKTWASRPVFARRAMAQTRAMSRACRSAFAFVVTLMDAGLETTPAEEMTHVVNAIETGAPATSPVGRDGSVVARRDATESPANVEPPLAIKIATHIAQATTVRTLGKIEDRMAVLVSEGQLTVEEAEELSAAVNRRHDQIEPQAQEVVNG